MTAAASSSNAGSAPGTGRSVISLVEEFLANCKEPGLVETGEPILPLLPAEYSIEPDGDGAVLEAWGGHKILRRRIKRVVARGRDKLELAVERFPRKAGRLTLIDLQSLSQSRFESDSAREVEVARLRLWCERLFPLWRIESLSGSADLENTLSPRFPRALLRLGTKGLAVFSSPDVESSADALAFALIWLNYLRSQWRELDIQGLALFVPREAIAAAGLRLRWLNGDIAQFRLFAWDSHNIPEEIRSRAWGNMDSSVVVRPRERPVGTDVLDLFAKVAEAGDAELVRNVNGTVQLEVWGLPIASADGDCLRTGLQLRPASQLPKVDSLRKLARRVHTIRQAASNSTNHPIYRAYPERWLEAMVRQNIGVIDPSINPSTLRRQVGGYLGVDHTRTDLLALDHAGNTVILEIKAQEDVGLPIQALDYYIRLRMHLTRGEMSGGTVFSSAPLSQRPPKLLLIAPALCFHPTNETVLRYFESSIAVRQIGVALEWRKKLRVMFDHVRTEHGSGNSGKRSSEWQAISSIKSERPFPP